MPQKVQQQIFFVLQEVCPHFQCLLFSKFIKIKYQICLKKLVFLQDNLWRSKLFKKTKNNRVWWTRNVLNLQKSLIYSIIKEIWAKRFMFSKPRVCTVRLSTLKKFLEVLYDIAWKNEGRRGCSLSWVRQNCNQGGRNPPFGHGWCFQYRPGEQPCAVLHPWSQFC